MQTHVAIIGAGLSGLYSAYLLQKLNINYTIFEARDRIGGRIISMPLPEQENTSTTHDRYDLGPSWFWPDMHGHMMQLVANLGLKTFPQYQTGAHLFDRGHHQSPQRYELGFANSPQSMRLAGGMYSLIEALANHIDNDKILLNNRVTAIEESNNVNVHFHQDEGETISQTFSHIITAIPPRLLIKSISFNPALPDGLHHRFSETVTWMAAHAKFVAVYPNAFWRQQGLAGSASSQSGPLVEIHDASTIDGHAALFGFIGLNAAARKTAGREALISHCINQLSRLFGPEATKPEQAFLIDWSEEDYTATEQDHAGASSHPLYGLPEETRNLWQGKLLFAGSELANADGGYLEGALNAAHRAVTLLTR